MANLLRGIRLPAGIKRYATPTNIVLVAGGLMAAYLGYQYFTNGPGDAKVGKSAKLHGKLGPNVGSNQGVDNPRLELVVSPIVVKPNIPTPIHIKGVFLDDSNQPSAVGEGFFTIFDSKNNIITQGSLGRNLAEFDKTVQLPPLPDGIISVQVSDSPIEQNEGATVNA